MDFSEIAGQLAHPRGALGIETGNSMNAMNAFISKNTYDLLEISDRNKILEIGLGNGKFIADVLEQANNISFTGIDISETMIETAKATNKGKPNVHLEVAGIENLPFPDESFDKICTVNTIYFWNNINQALQEVRRVLSNQGIFVVAFRPYSKGQTLDFTEYGFKEYTVEETKQILIDNNFKIINSINKTEPEIEFNGQTHQLNSHYFLVQKADL